MRLSEVVLVLCLLLWACVGSNTMARKTGLVSNLFDGAKKENTSVALDDAHRSNTKRHQLGHHHLSCSENTTTLSDDKRVVPTGPNPLHNR